MPALQRDLGLDLLRIAAAFLVLVHHYTYRMWDFYGSQPLFCRRVSPLSWFGWVGVEIFFVISGFVIFHSAQRADWATFARNRFLRLYPTAWICATVTLATLAFSHTRLPAEHLFHRYLHTLPLIARRPDWIDGSFWTLPIELMFYLLVATTLRFAGTARLETACTALGVYSTAACLLVCLARRHTVAPLPGEHLWLWIGTEKADLLLTMNGVFFAIGALLHQVLTNAPTRRRMLFLLLFLPGAGYEIVLHSRLSDLNNGTDHSPATPFVIWFAAVLFAIASTRANTAFSARLGPRGGDLVRVAAITTYPLYLVHQRVGYVLILAGRRWLPVPAAMLVTAALMVALSYAIAHWIEPHLRRPLRDLLTRRRKATPEVAASLP